MNVISGRPAIGSAATAVVPEVVAKDLNHGAGFTMAPVQPTDDATDEVAAALDTDPEL
jgi:hypothetical protein